MNFWQGFIIGVIVTQIFLGFVLVKAGVIADVIRYLESGLTQRAVDATPTSEGDSESNNGVRR